MRKQIDASEPAGVSFTLGPASSRTVFPFASVTGVVFTRQTGTSTFSTSALPFAAVPVFPGAIGTVAYGKFSSPDYELPQRAIPAYPTGKAGQPVPQRTNDIYVNVYLPSGPRPARGWPVAIFGHGFTDSKQGAPVAVASSMAKNGIDLMQLVRVIQVGIDVDGDGSRDLDSDSIFYFGQSFGGIYGTTFMAVEPDVHAGVVNVPGGAIIEIARLSPFFRPLVGFRLLTRVPPLYNAVPNPFLTNFVENVPLHGQPVLVDVVPEADAIQHNLDRAIWAQTLADPVAYARHIRADPLTRVDPKAIVVQFAKGDQTVPNPTTSALIRAVGLEDRAT